MSRMIAFYNGEVSRLDDAFPGLEKKAREAKVDDFINNDAKNVVMGFPSSESRSRFSVFITDHVANLSAVDMVGSQYFSLYLYEKDGEAEDGELFAEGKATEPTYTRRDAITDKDSGIVNDANRWATETVANAKYPLELFLRVIIVSLETMKIVGHLPPFEPQP